MALDGTGMMNCVDAGNDSFGLVVASLGLSVITTVATFLRAIHLADSSVEKTVAIIAPFVAFIFALSAFSIWDNLCYTNIVANFVNVYSNDDVNNPTNGEYTSYSSNFEHGTGYWITVLGFILCLGLFLVNLLTSSHFERVANDDSMLS